MNAFQRFRIKNAMVLGNFVSNLVGVVVVDTVVTRSVSPPPPVVTALIERIDTVFTPLVFILVGVASILYELPIRRRLDGVLLHRRDGRRDAPDARRRLLNLPFVFIGYDLAVWVTAAIFYTGAIHWFHPGLMSLGRIFVQTLMVGLVTSIVAFFILERTLQKTLAPLFFPEGGLCAVPKTIRIRIFVRVGALVVACNLMPCLAVLAAIRGSYDSPDPPEVLLGLMRSSIATNCLLFIGVGVLLAMLVSSSLSRPFGEIVAVLRDIQRGRLNRKVRVTTSDEIGYTGDVINEMTAGLREREKMRHSLLLAREVQQNLLPRSPPKVAGLDIAGRSVYCDQTGGDYLDYLRSASVGNRGVGIVVGDVSGHGIPSALLMTTGRAFLRLRAAQPGDSAEVISDVNRQLARDVEETGQFMTLFYLLIDTATPRLTWVRAGHEPGLLYDPGVDRFTELSGPGIALGVDEGWRYEQNGMDGIRPGQIIVLGTDGIWEAQNARGELFGKERFKAVIRSRRDAAAGEILGAVFRALEGFRRGVAPADDLTLVVVRVTGGGGRGAGDSRLTPASRTAGRKPGAAPPEFTGKRLRSGEGKAPGRDAPGRCQAERAMRKPRLRSRCSGTKRPLSAQRTSRAP